MLMTIINEITTDNRIHLLIHCGFVFEHIRNNAYQIIMVHRKFNEYRIILDILICFDIVIDDTDLSLKFCTSVSVTRITR